ncbi:hypothetical protein [Azospirillum sp. B4]|uniref:hypothetical protein n=1 Tax=Azospirillum sp. B4 TaxID=95605 RepID=UPI000348E007|nr:hypothetical protein [Azospirillum sp. B4]
MSTLELDPAFVAACEAHGLDPQKTNMFLLECAVQGREPSKVSMFDLDRQASDLWAKVRKLNRAA